MKHTLLALLFVVPTLGLTAAEKTSEHLTLMEAWKTALRESPTEQAANARMEQARARYRQARAAYQPQLGLRASGARVEYSDLTRSRIPGAPDSVEQYEAGLEAGWLLWNNGARKHGVEAARYAAEAAVSARGDTREQLLAEVGRAFTSAQLARANLRIAEADQEFQERQLENSVRKEEAGLSSRADRLNFEIRKLAAENTAVLQAAEYEASMAALKALLGQPPESDLPPPAELDPEIDAPPPPGMDTRWATLRNNLPALKQAELNVQAAEEELAALKGEYGPEISAFGTLSTDREEDPGFSGEDVGNTVGLQLSWDLWTGDRRKQRVEEARAAVEEARAALKQVRLRARAQLHENLSTYTASLKSENLSGRTLELSRENRNLVEASYQAGRETLLRLNEAQKDFNNAGARYAAASLQRRLAWIELQRAVGQLMDMVQPEEE